MILLILFLGFFEYGSAEDGAGYPDWRRGGATSEKDH